jgi:hypothetical protein
MKIIKLNENNPYKEYLYDYLDWILEFGNNYLSFVFLKKLYLDGHILHLPRWITKKRMDDIDKEVQDLIDHLNWE